MSYIGNIYLSNNCVLKASSETQNYVFGFNIETEEPVKVLKKTLIKLPPSLLSIIRSHRVQLLVAESIIVTQTKKRVTAATIAPIMNLSERSLYRVMKEEDLYICKYENVLNRRK
jgi:hypothetical protein